MLDFGCSTSSDCLGKSTACTLPSLQDRQRKARRVPILMLMCHAFWVCTKAVDPPKEDGETDASYHQEMDMLHWN